MMFLILLTLVNDHIRTVVTVLQDVPSVAGPKWLSKKGPISHFHSERKRLSLGPRGGTPQSGKVVEERTLEGSSTKQVVSLTPDLPPASKGAQADGGDVSLVVGWSVEGGKGRASRIGVHHLLNPPFQVSSQFLTQVPLLHPPFKVKWHDSASEFDFVNDPSAIVLVSAIQTSLPLPPDYYLLRNCFPGLESSYNLFCFFELWSARARSISTLMIWT
jgi:hypothetical protein